MVKNKKCVEKEKNMFSENKFVKIKKIVPSVIECNINKEVSNNMRDIEYDEDNYQKDAKHFKIVNILLERRSFRRTLFSFP